MMSLTVSDPETPRGEAAPSADQPSPVGRIVLGALLVLAGLAWVAETAGAASLRWPLLVAGALMLVGAGLLATVRRGGHDGLVSLGIVLVVLALVTSVAPPTDAWSAVGERTVRPQTASELADATDLAIGSLTVDLRDLPAGDDPGLLEAGVGVGELVVVLPHDAAASVRASVGVGQVTILERQAAGLGVSRDERLPGSGDVWQLDLSTGLGQVEVRR